MKEYNVVFCHSVRVQADDEDAAEELAWAEFATVDITNADDFPCMVEEMES